jgi:DNA (cytosine-5)-methyltransferase 1
VDIAPQPRYPFEFHQADAMTYPLDGFSAAHASPPCQAYSRITRCQGDPSAHPDLLAPTREMLRHSDLAWIIENVPGAPMRTDYRLCGCMFGLAVQRERWFETSWRGFSLRPPCSHAAAAIGVYGYGGPRPGSGRISGRLQRWQDAMGIDWMESLDLTQAIPPAYTEYLGNELLAHLREVAA